MFDMYSSILIITIKRMYRCYYPLPPCFQRWGNWDSGMSNKLSVITKLKNPENEIKKNHSCLIHQIYTIQAIINFNTLKNNTVFLFFYLFYCNYNLSLIQISFIYFRIRDSAPFSANREASWKIHWWDFEEGTSCVSFIGWREWLCERVMITYLFFPKDR